MATKNENELNYEKLIKMVDDGVEQSKLLDEFEFKNRTQLKVAYVDGLIELKKIPAINCPKGRKQKPISKTISVNSRGSLIINKKLVNNMGLKAGDTFEVNKLSSNNIQLKYIPSEAEKTSSHTPQPKEPKKEPKEDSKKKAKKTVDNSQPDASKKEQ